MKKILLLSAIGLACAGSGLAQSKFDARGLTAITYYKQTLETPNAKLAVPTDLPFSYNPQSRSAAEAKVFARMVPGATEADLKAQGYDVEAVYGDFALINGSIDRIITLEDCEYVDAVSFDELATPLLDNARADIKMDAVHAGSGLPQAYNGKGVIAGIFDIGGDPNHINFKDANGNLRIKQLYHYPSSGRALLYNTPAAIQGFTTDSKNEMHGTHTTGCMAGSYKGNATELATNSGVSQNQPINYYGMASGAEIFPAYGQLYASSYIDFLKKAKDYSAQQGKPVVVNFSFGSIGGSLDGTETSASSIDQYAKDIPVFISSGNDGDVNLGINKTFASADDILKTFIYPASGAVDKTYSGNIQFYSNNNEPFTITFLIYNANRRNPKEYYVYPEIAGPFSGTQTYSGTDLSGPNYNSTAQFGAAYAAGSFVTVSAGIDPYSGRYRVNANVKLQFASNNAGGTYIMGVYIKGKPGQTVSCLNTTGYTTGGYTYRGTFSGKSMDGFVDGTPELSVNSLSTGQHPIVVGAYTTRMSWPKLPGGTGGYTSDPGYKGIGEISPFSSYGVLVGGRTLPHICAPGAGIISSTSNYAINQRSSSIADVAEASRHNYFLATQGTSMSSPIAAGVAAVWLEANPNLSPKDIRDIMMESARKDAQVNGGVKAQWGAGKIDALEGLKKALSWSGINDIVSDKDQEAIISPVGHNQWQISLPGIEGINANLYGIAGQLAANFKSNSDNVTVDASNLRAGVYILNINGNKSVKLIVK